MDRPTHARVVRPAVVELPLWAASRSVLLGRAACTRLVDAAADYRDAYRDAGPIVRRLAAAAAISTAVLFGLAIAIAYMLS